MRQLVLLALLCWTLQLTPSNVTRVIDGDTFVLNAVQVWPGVAAINEKVRVRDVDTPELSEPLGKEAKQFTEQWLATAAFDLKVCRRDSFGRVLGEVTRSGSLSLSESLKKAGLAK